MDDRFGVNALLLPPPDGAGDAGPDMRGGNSAGTARYLAIKDARAEARLAERDALASGDPDATPLAAGLRGWAAVTDDAVALLAETKDLQVAAWLTEAWLRTDGFPGLAAGFALLSGLVEGWWEAGLHPAEDEDGIETRVAPLFGLFGHADAGTLLQPIKLLPLSDHAPPAVALWTVEAIRAQSVRHDDPDLAEELAERRRLQIAALEDAIGRASPGFAAAAATGIAEALTALDRLMAAVDARTPFGRFGSQVSRPLEDAATLLRVHGPAAAATADGAQGVDAAATPVGDPAPAATPAPGRPGGMDREGALATLLEVAAFFDHNEPQSLIGDSLRNVVRRANLSIDELLAELLPDAGQRALFLLRAGIGRGDDTGY